MSEWLKEHAWKLIPFALNNAHRHAPTHSPSTTSCNNDVYRSVPVNRGACPGFQGVSDTVLTQAGFQLPQTHIKERWVIRGQANRLLNSRCPLAASLLIRALATCLASSLSEASTV